MLGYNHIKAGKVCEDASGWYSDEKMKICVIADGHGSDNYPRTNRGAGFAVAAAQNCIIELALESIISCIVPMCSWF